MLQGSSAPCPLGQLAPRKRQPRPRLTLLRLYPTMNGSCPLSFTNANAAVLASSRAFASCSLARTSEAAASAKPPKPSSSMLMAGLLYLAQDLELGSMLVLTNPFTQDELECRVVYLGDDCDKGRRIGIEFLTPSPRFWGVEFAQPDWVPAQQN